MQAIFKKLLISQLVLIFLLVPTISMAETYVVGTEPAYAPWAYVEDGEFKGISLDAMRAMAEQQGFDIKFKSLPFSSLIPALKAGKIDILATALTVSEKRAKQIDFTVPWWQVNMISLVRRDSDLNGVTALCCGATVGTMTATTDYHWLKNELKKNGVDITIKGYPKATIAVKDLLIGRLDSVLLDATPAKGFQEANADQLRIASVMHPYPPQVYALGIAEDNEDLLALLNKGVVELYESGKWGQIVHKYLPSATIGQVPAPMAIDIPAYEAPIPGLSDAQ